MRIDQHEFAPAGIDGDNDSDFAMSEMLLEQYSHLWAGAFPPPRFRANMVRAGDAGARTHSYGNYTKTG